MNRHDNDAMASNIRNIDAIKSGRKKAKLTTVQMLKQGQIDDWLKNTSPEDRRMKDYSGRPSARAKFYKEMEKVARAKGEDLNVSKMGDDDVFSQEPAGLRNEDPLGLSGQRGFKFQKDTGGKRISMKDLKKRSGDFHSNWTGHAGDIFGTGIGVDPETAGTIEDIGTTLAPTELSDIPLSIAAPGAGKAAVKTGAKAVKSVKRKVLSKGKPKLPGGKAQPGSPKKHVKLNPDKIKRKRAKQTGDTQQMRKIDLDPSKLKKLKGKLKELGVKVAKAPDQFTPLTLKNLKDSGLGSTIKTILFSKAGAGTIYTLHTAYKALGKNETLDKEILGAIREKLNLKSDKDARRIGKASSNAYEKSQAENRKMENIFKDKRISKKDRQLKAIDELIKADVFPGGKIDEKLLKPYFTDLNRRLGTSATGTYESFLRNLETRLKSKNQVKEHIVNLVMEAFGY